MVHLNSPTYITIKFPLCRGIQFIKQIVGGDILFLSDFQHVTGSVCVSYSQNYDWNKI